MGRVSDELPGSTALNRWARKAAGLVHASVTSVLRERGQCNLILTGGRAAEAMYCAWTLLPEFSNLRNVNFYFGDERCVSHNESDSNYNLVMRSLFANGVPKTCTIYRMEADSGDATESADSYSRALPMHIDILLLGVGEDGHIASLFPHSSALHESGRRVVFVIGPKPPIRRLTITPPVIRQASSVFVLAHGRAKAAVLARALREPDDIDTLPARMVLAANWIVDPDPASEIDVREY